MVQRRTTVALGTAVAVAAGLVVAGVAVYGGAGPSPSSELVAEVRTLMDPQGLVHDPVDAQSAPIDLYASALLGSALAANGMPTDGVQLDRLSEADLQASLGTLQLPPEYLAWSVDELEAVYGGELAVPQPAAVPPVPVPTGNLPTDATNLWLAAVAAARDGDPGAQAGPLAEAIRGLLPQVGPNAFVGWRLIESCGLLAVDCPLPTGLTAAPGIPDAEAVLSWWGAAELTARGAVLTGFDPPAAAETAEKALTALPDGEDLMAAALSRVVALGGRGTAALESYLFQAEQRREPTSGLLRTRLNAAGSVQRTYDAARLLGDQLDEVVTEATVPTLRQAVVAPAQGRTLDPLRAAVVLDLLGEDLSEQEQAALDAAVSATIGKIGPSANAASVEAVELLAAMDRLPDGGLVLDPEPPAQAGESALLDLVTLAGSGLLANSADVLARHADYLAGLPAQTRSEGPASPLYLDRLEALARTAQPPTGDPELASGLSALAGCDGYPQLYRITADPAAPCGVATTLAARDVAGALQLTMP